LQGAVDGRQVCRKDPLQFVGFCLQFVPQESRTQVVRQRAYLFFREIAAIVAREAAWRYAAKAIIHTFYARVLRGSQHSRPEGEFWLPGYLSLTQTAHNGPRFFSRNDLSFVGVYSLNGKLKTVYKLYKGFSFA
jgi:hypothetical protein